MRSDELIPEGPVEEAGGEDEMIRMQFFVTFLFFLLFFFVMEALNHKYKPLIGHETCATVVLGIVWSIFFYKYAGPNPHTIELYSFSHSAFFDFLLPPIIYNSGFNMRRRSFFSNLGNVMIFGLGVTFFCFVLYSVCSYLVLTNMDLTMTKYVTEDGVPVTQKVELSIMSMLLFTSLLCSSDVVAAVSIVDYEAQPKLYSCIFGEGVTNDIVSIIIFNAILSLQGKQFTSNTPFEILE